MKNEMKNIKEEEYLETRKSDRVKSIVDYYASVI